MQFPPILLATLLSLAATPAFALELHSKSIAEGQTLPMAQVLNNFGCEGQNISPDLSWRGAPEGTKSFAVTAYDPDAATGSGWWHWVVFNIPATTAEVAAGAGDLPAGVVQSRTDFNAPGYGGACPPPGPMHRYRFTVHALSAEKIDMDENAPPAQVGFAMSFSTLATASITTTYLRN